MTSPSSNAVNDANYFGMISSFSVALRYVQLEILCFTGSDSAPAYSHVERTKASPSTSEVAYGFFAIASIAP